MRGIYFIDPADAEFKKTIEKIAERVVSSDASSCALQDRRRTYRETWSTSGTRKTKYACIVQADESTRKRLEGTLHNDHEDNIAGKGINSLIHYNLVHKFILMPQAMKIPEAKAAVDKEWEKLQKVQHGN